MLGHDHLSATEIYANLSPEFVLQDFQANTATARQLTTTSPEPFLSLSPSAPWLGKASLRTPPVGSSGDEAVVGSAIYLMP